MSELNVEQFADMLEERYGAGIYRKIRVIPAMGTRKKKPVGEKSNMPRADIIKNRIGDANWDNFSFAIKYSEELYCVDFDTKIFKNPEFFDTLRECGAFHTETQKGWHFYINIVGLPRFQNEINLANSDYFDSPQDVDLLYQKRNVWEPRDRPVQGCSFTNVNWDDISKYFNTPKMNFVGVEEQVAPVVVADDPVPEEEVVVQAEAVEIATCDEDAMRGFLNRLNPERASDYESWLKISMAIYTNFHELDDIITGYILFDEWSSKVAGYNKKNNKKVWDGFRTRPTNPLTYKSIRKLADEDSTENVYESIYKSRGSDAMVEYVNESYIYNLSSSNVIYMDNGKHYLKKCQDVGNDLRRFNFIIEDSKGKAHLMKPCDIWLDSTKRKCVRAIDFDPTGKKYNIYNLFKGYFVTRENCQDSDVAMCQPLLDHIKNVWCRGNEHYYQYVLNWFGWVLQRPDTKIGVMLCVRSRQGGGKGTVLDIFHYLLDGDRDTDYYAQVSNLESIIGNFTTGIQGKCLINFDEAFWGGDKKKEGMIKNLITETNQEIRVKNHNPYNIKNTTAFILTTNAERFSGVTKDDRRHFCLECDDSHLDTKSKEELGAYFTALQGRKYNEPQNAEMCHSFAKVLYARDLSRFNPQEFPKTELAFNQIQQGWDSVVKFWFNVLNTGTLYQTERWDCRLDGQGELGDWGMGDNQFEVPGVLDETNPQAPFQKIYKNFVYYSYQKLNLGGYNAHGREDTTQFWVITRRIFSRRGLTQTQSRDDNGVLKRFICFEPIEVLKAEFQYHQKAEHLSIWE